MILLEMMLEVVMVMGVLYMEVDKVPDEVADMEIDWQLDWHAGKDNQDSMYVSLAIGAQIFN